MSSSHPYRYADDIRRRISSTETPAGFRCSDHGRRHRQSFSFAEEPRNVRFPALKLRLQYLDLMEQSRSEAGGDASSRRRALYTILHRLVSKVCSGSPAQHHDMTQPRRWQKSSSRRGRYVIRPPDCTIATADDIATPACSAITRGPEEARESAEMDALHRFRDGRARSTVRAAPTARRIAARQVSAPRRATPQPPFRLREHLWGRC